MSAVVKTKLVYQGI